MPILVHIANEKDCAGIIKGGIRPGKSNKVVYFMPVLLNHFVSHQWIRELRRNGANVLVGVYFRLPSTETVWASRFNEEHRRVSLGEAIAEISSLSDPLGYEMFIDRKIEACEILKVRHLPQKIGWRYSPHAHGRKPCGCPACTPRGSYGSARIREEYNALDFVRVPFEELKQTVLESQDEEILLDAVWALRNKRRNVDPSFLEKIITFKNDELHEALAITLAYFRHPHTRKMLSALCDHTSAEVREAAAESAFQLYKSDASKMLGSIAAADPVISNVLIEKQRMKEAFECAPRQGKRSTTDTDRIGNPNQEV